MKKKRNIRGFTMAELLIVVAVITVLSGVGFIALKTHQDKMAKLEANTIAKEIFFAAQNHLTMAESEGYLADSVGSSFYGTSTSRLDRDDTKAKDIYYFSVSGSSAFGGNTVLDLMLPFGSIDDTIRLSGNYVIRYQANPARVLDVWYGKSGKVTLPAIGELVGITTGRNGIGYYGGDAALEGGVTLNAPTITVNNAERLTVTVDLTNVKTGVTDQTFLGDTEALTVKLVITGKSSGAMAAIPMAYSQRAAKPDTNKEIYEVVLDDITKAYANNDGGHFAEIKTNAPATGTKIDVIGEFTPGENIVVQAVAFSTKYLTSIAYSNEVTTNSLFADYDETNHVAKVSCFRHLENLDPLISGLNAGTLGLTKAEQIANLVWDGTDANAFTTKIQTAKPTVYSSTNPVKVYKIPVSGAETADQGTAPGCYLPVNIDYALVYDGAYTEGTGNTAVKKCHSITGVKVAGAKNTDSGADTPFSGDGGLFGTVTGALTVKNLELIDFSINCTGNAGALAGELGKDQGPVILITNVLAHNSKTGTTTIASSSGSAGGLIGSMTGATVQKCAAAMVVSSISGNAGGLIGESHGTSTVTASYSGGRTKAKKESNDTTASGYKDTNPAYNVTGGAGAGGLIGDQGQTTIDYCYSTCSVSGTTAGGLVGKTGGTINHSYCTGLVNGTNKGAFAGQKPTIEAGNDAVCWYFQIINKPENATDYLPPAPNCASGDESDPAQGSGVEKIAKLKRLDADAKSYNDFCGAPANWKEAHPTEASGLTVLYPATDSDDEEVAKYNLKTVKQLGADVVETATATTPADFVATHYGDWPAPEILVVNTKSGSQNQNTNP